MEGELTHFNEQGRARMVDVTSKDITERVAVATAEVHLKPETLRLIKEGQIKKGDVLAVAQVAGIMGAKKTPDLIPMCHPLALSNVDIGFSEDLDPDPQTGLCVIHITARVKVTAKTGVEMEALTAASVAALTIYDMCKAVDKGMTFQNIRLEHKSGGKSGVFDRG
ncbi:MAG: cyclic pyranopterin monophosphate synthase MoaC [Nitrospinae bacterium CG11_big_fil_rev_8_21_14_0_20_56_8]|nr:MAG: cyclic pyranopterin monophosphate synthase MoaC [Nitrospinae bacterium CG11_big_fil_rev_8_21_14_0_20_56_8]